MSEITTEKIKYSIVSFLNDELEKELAKSISEMKNPTEKKINNKREKLKFSSDFNFTLWLEQLKGSIEFMSNEMLSLATHSAKGIHSALKSDNVLMKKNTKLPIGILGFQNIDNPKLDANSNNTGSHAGHLKIIVNFLNINLLDNRIYQWIMNENDTVRDFLNKNISKSSFDYFYSLLSYEINRPVSDAKNKQLLFPINDEIYHCIIPLYPSVMCNYLYGSIQYIKYSEESKQARKNRKDNKNVESYKDIIDLAYIKLGGDNAQNVTRLNNEQGGRNYLLPSMPPIISKSYDFKLSKFADNFFGKSLIYHCYQPLEQFDNVIKNKKNTIDIRDDRKLAIDEMLHTIFSIAKQIQTTYSAGWSSDYRLNYSQKLWLDPRRADLEGEEDFANDREQLDWYLDINRQFADWLNKLIRKKFPDIKYDIGDSEHTEWQREIEDMSKYYERAGKGVFL